MASLSSLLLSSPHIWSTLKLYRQKSKRGAMSETTNPRPRVTMPDFTTSTNLGPLTTKASFPEECFSDLYDMHTIGLGLPWTYNTAGCAVSSCCPSSQPYTYDWGWMTSYYSPGVCPSGYRGCDPPGEPTQLSTKPGETIAFCCPNSELPSGRLRLVTVANQRKKTLGAQRLMTTSMAFAVVSCRPRRPSPC